MRYVVIDGFFGDAAGLRRVVDQRLSDRLPPFDPSRFVWEHWHVDAQFSQLRTPARTFFPEPLIGAFEARLLRWARASFGVSRLGGPPWLSAILDGGFQGVHRDSPNGQIAWSFGLGKSGRFRGGHTLIANDELLDYFRSGSHRPEAADKPLFDEVVPRFNRLVAFDSRIPHAVRGVEGPRHPRDARIALQGWLEVNGCVVDGASDVGPATHAVNAELRDARMRRDLAGAEGLFAVRLTTGRDGRVGKTAVVASTLVRTSDARDQPARAERLLTKRLARVRFPAGAKHVLAPIIVAPSGRARVPFENGS